MRHAHALTAEEAIERPLSDRGRAAIQQIAGFFLSNAELSPAQVWHSPLMRARETADLLVQGLRLDCARVETAGLLPEDEPYLMAERLARYPTDHDLILVGHEPHLSALATLLVRGKARPVAFNLRKGAMISLSAADGVHKLNGLPRWRVRWHFSPELLPAAT